MFGILPDLEDKERPTGKSATSKILIKNLYGILVQNFKSYLLITLLMNHNHSRHNVLTDATLWYPYKKVR